MWLGQEEQGGSQSWRSEDVREQWREDSSMGQGQYFSWDLVSKGLGFEGDKIYMGGVRHTCNPRGSEVEIERS